jgi:tRNA1Val (adenine37-N6)-methyltransferase
MANNWFQFKQFRIAQDQCAMKVSTDACIQGAWAAEAFRRQAGGGDVLDIGTGTGLLSLMLAQHMPASRFDGIEIDTAACNQACSNFAGAPWKDRLRAVQTSLQEYTAAQVKRALYQFIICNPPFFHNQLQAEERSRNLARHGIIMGKEELAFSVSKLLLPGGMFCVMYPSAEWPEWHEAAGAHNLHLRNLLNIQPKPASPPNRRIGIYSGTNNGQPAISEDLVIYSAPGIYTPEFSRLLAPYYLAL